MRNFYFVMLVFIFLSIIFFWDNIHQKVNWLFYKNNPVGILSQNSIDPDFSEYYWKFMLFNKKEKYDQSLSYCAANTQMPNCQNLGRFNSSWINLYGNFNTAMLYSGGCMYDPRLGRFNINENCVPPCNHQNWTQKEILTFINSGFSLSACSDLFGTDNTPVQANPNGNNFDFYQVLSKS